MAGMHNTEFARWRQKIGLTQEASSRALGVTLRTIQHWESGATSRGTDSVPPLSVRIAMSALLKNPKIEPWPE